jgi:hypothetical protein
MTPAANPKLLASRRGEARCTQNTTAAPIELAAPAPTTIAKAAPTLPLDAIVYAAV